ncbi:MFS transporter, partial [Streptomyces capoamus]
MPVVRDLRVLLRLRNFRRLLSVRLLSQGADGVYQVALAAYVVFSPEKQTSATAVASAMAVLLLPYSLVGPFAGVLLDRWRRRQVFVYGNLLRALLAAATAVLVLGHAPDWLFFASALCVTAVNRFVLAGLSAALPRVVDAERLVLANSLSPTAGTLAATAGGALAFGVRIVASGSDAAVVLAGAVLYACASLVSLSLAPDLLGPDRHPARPRLAR